MSAEDRIRSWMEAAGAEKVKPSGTNMIGTCPYHDDEHRSFSMSTETGQFTCFAESCGKQGALVSFLTTAVGYSYKRAHRLALDFGDDVGNPDEGVWTLPEWNSRREPAERSVVDERIVGIYDFCPAYLLDRRFSKKVLRRWDIGYDFETRHVTLPVRDVDGACVGISRRVTWKTDEAKYLHLGFPKSRFLYGAHFIKYPSVVWVGEGQLDAIALDQLLLSSTNTVSTMGARVSEAQIEALAKMHTVVLAFDNDRDGRIATVRVGEGLISRGKGKNVYVADCWPNGVKDPADMLRKSEALVNRFISTNTPYDEWRTQALFQSDLIRARVFNREKERRRWES